MKDPNATHPELAGAKNHPGWLPGPLPPGTWNWGGVVTKETTGGAFLFADFCGDYVKTEPDEKVVKAEEVIWYNNALDVSPQWLTGDSCPGPAKVE